MTRTQKLQINGQVSSAVCSQRLCELLTCWDSHKLGGEAGGGGGGGLPGELRSLNMSAGSAQPVAFPAGDQQRT